MSSHWNFHDVEQSLQEFIAASAKNWNFSPPVPPHGTPTPAPTTPPGNGGTMSWSGQWSLRSAAQTTQQAINPVRFGIGDEVDFYDLGGRPLVGALVITRGSSFQPYCIAQDDYGVIVGLRGAEYEIDVYNPASVGKLAEISLYEKYLRHRPAATGVVSYAEKTTQTSKSNGVCVCDFQELLKSGCRCGSIVRYAAKGFGGIG